MLRRYPVAAATLVALAFASSLGCSAFSGDDSQRDGGAPRGGCNGRVDCERTVFVTGAEFVGGDLGGLVGADAECQRAANTSNVDRVRGREYRAWLSDQSTSAAGRLAHGSNPYKKPDGTTVASSWSVLISGTLESALNVDERGEIVPTGTTWTGTAWTGDMYGTVNCGNWRDRSGVAMIGSAGLTSSAWTHGEAGFRQCTELARLYCFEY